jgi:hypothetical protein
MRTPIEKIASTAVSALVTGLLPNVAGNSSESPLGVSAGSRLAWNAGKKDREYSGQSSEAPFIKSYIFFKCGTEPRAAARAIIWKPC